MANRQISNFFALLNIVALCLLQNVFYKILRYDIWNKANIKIQYVILFEISGFILFRNSENMVIIATWRNLLNEVFDKVLIIFYNQISKTS